MQLYKKIGLTVLLVLSALITWYQSSETPPPPAPPQQEILPPAPPAPPSQQQEQEQQQEPVPPAPEPDFQLEDLRYNGKPVIVTKHAQCRMDCRNISAVEVQEVITEGSINKAKSDPLDKPCPTRALEDWTKDEQLVRIIIAECEDVAKLVTVIDLKNEYQCTCN